MKIGDQLVVTNLNFGVGKNDFLTNAMGSIFVTDLPSSLSEGKLNQIGVFGDKQNFVISFSEETSFTQGAKVSGAKSDRGIYTIPANTHLQGVFTVKKLR